MARYGKPRVLPMILAIVIIIVAIVGLVALARLLFGGGQPAATEQVDTSRQQLLDTTSGNAVSLTVRGPIVAQENFKSFRITVSPNTRDVEAYKGYLETINAEETFSNNTAAYEEFVFALDKANLVVGDPLPEDKNDVRGICATGNVYEYRLIKDGEVVEMLWTSTCKGSPGSLEASTEQLSELFYSQIPKGSEIADKLDIRSSSGLRL